MHAYKQKLRQNATANWNDCTPGYVFFTQSLMQTLARSGSTKTGPFHGLRQHPVHAVNPLDYGAKAEIERTSLLQDE